MTFAVIATAVAAFSILELQSSNGLLDDLALIQPGAKLDTFKAKLGQEIGTIDDLDEMTHIGSIKDRDFCQETTSSFRRCQVALGAK